MRQKRPMLVLAWKPGLKAPWVQLKFKSFTSFPLMIIMTSVAGVCPRFSCAKYGSQRASATAKSTGMYSGRHPLMTPFTATLQTVASRFSGFTMPSTSSGFRSVYFKNSSTFSSVGGTIGSPSLHSFSRKYSLTSS